MKNHRIAVISAALSLISSIALFPQKNEAAVKWRNAGDPIPASFFGMIANKPSDLTFLDDTVSVGAIGHPTYLAFGCNEPRKGEFTWQEYDSFVSYCDEKHIPFMITFGSIPRWAQRKSTNGISVEKMKKHSDSVPPDPNEWKDFVTAAADHFKGRVRYWELWNEANGQFWAGSIEELVSLAAIAYPIIKAADPNAIVLTPSVLGNVRSAADWMDTYLKAGGNKYADGVTFHGYIEGILPHTPRVPFPDDVSKPTGSILAWAQAFRKVADNNGMKGKPIFDTEGGSGQERVTNSDDQAAFVAQWLIMQASAGVEAVYWFRWGGRAADEEAKMAAAAKRQQQNGKKGQPFTAKHWWGWIQNPDGTPDAAGIAYGQVQRWLTGASFKTPCFNSGTRWSATITRPGGYEALIVWSLTSEESFTPSRACARVRDLAGGSIPVTDTVTIGRKPVLLEYK